MTCDECGDSIEGEQVYKASDGENSGLGVYHPDCIQRKG